MSVDAAVPYHDGYIFDLDGTIYLDDHLLPHAKEVVQALRGRGAQVLFLSNKPLERREAYAAKLTRLGIPTRAQEVINSSLVMARYLVAQKPDAHLFVIGERPLLDELASAGLNVTCDPAAILGDGHRAEMNPPGDSLPSPQLGTHALRSASRPAVDYVVVAMDRSLRYAQLDAALTALRRGAKLVATNPDSTCPVADGEIPDTGATLAALYAASGIRPEAITGKPDPLMAKTALEWLGLPAERCLIAGDRLETDILMGITAGMSTALLLTGVTTLQMLRERDMSPTYVLPDLSRLAPGLSAQRTEALEAKEHAQ